MKEPKVKGDQIDAIVSHLIKSGKVKVTRLGKFSVVRVRGKFYDINTKKAVSRDYKKVKFVATKSLKGALNK